MSRHRGQEGFTLIEILVSLVVLIIGVTGVLTMQMTALRGTAYSRHATESIFLGEGKMEELIATTPVAVALAGNGADVVNARGQAPGPTDFQYNRSWTITGANPVLTITVVVAWVERGRDNHQMTFQGQRAF